MSVPRHQVKAIAVCMVLAVGTILAGCSQQPSHGTPKNSETAAALTDQQISDAYLYLLGRLLVLRQERLDFEKEGFEWNTLIYRTPGGVAWANPNLDVAYTEAWVAVDDKTCVRLDIPKIKGRYYTWHMLNGWDETVLNINERTYPNHPYGRFALCLKGSSATVPGDVVRVDLPSKTTRVLARIELGSNPKEAVRLQHEFKLTPMGQPQIDPVIQVPLFANDALPKSDAFDQADAILHGEADINPGMEEIRHWVAETEALIKSGPQGKARVDSVIEKQAWPTLVGMLHAPGPVQNGWSHPAAFGNYGDNYRMRTLVNLGGIWANNAKEATYFTRTDLDGSTTYTQTFPANALPKSKSRYFWSVIAIDAKEYKVIPNPLKRYLLNNQSKLKYNHDGSLTLVFAPTLPKGVPQGNWLPTPEGQKYNLTFRFYGPSDDVVNGQYYPPALMEKPQ